MRHLLSALKTGRSVVLIEGQVRADRALIISKLRSSGHIETKISQGFHRPPIPVVGEGLASRRVPLRRTRQIEQASAARYK
jgi:hypothetical protein